MLGKLSRAIVTPIALSTFLAGSALAHGTTPNVHITTPQEGQTMYGDKLPILLTVENFKLVDYQAYKTRVAGQGHIHLWLDDAGLSKESAIKTSQDSHTFENVPYGDHKLTAELVASDHSSLKPPQTAIANFKTAPVSAPSPSATSGFDKNSALVILIVVALVILAAWWYTKEEDEEMGTRAKSQETKKTTTKRSTKRKK